MTERKEANKKEPIATSNSGANATPDPVNLNSSLLQSIDQAPSVSPSDAENLRQELSKSAKQVNITDDSKLVQGY